MKNAIQFQKGYSLRHFLEDYGTEEQCREALFKWRWPDGYRCPHCGHTSHCQLRSRPLYQCNHCHHQESLTSGTIFASTKLPLTTWFLAIYFVTQTKSGVSALDLSRKLGVSYNTAWKLKHKLLQVMKDRDGQKSLCGILHVDDAYWGGESHGGKRGRGAQGKTPFVAALQVNEEGHPIAIQFCAVDGFRLDIIEQWTTQHVEAGSHVLSDGLACFRAVTAAECTHMPVVTGGGASSMEQQVFQWLNTVIGNVKNTLLAMTHGIHHKHLPRYLAEFCYRFNRRFELDTLFSRFGYIAARTPPMPYRLLILAEPRG